jgi:hypothetical protein
LGKLSGGFFTSANESHRAFAARILAAKKKRMHLSIHALRSENEALALRQRSFFR